MLKIKRKYNDNGTCEPERQLTDSENETVTRISGNETEYIYYQGDEPAVDVQPYQEPIEELPITEDQLIKIVAKAKELGLL